MTRANKRQYERFDVKRKVYYNFPYDFTSKVNVEPSDHSQSKQEALSKNVSTEGLCFHSDQALHKGDELDLEVYVPGDEEPVHLNGEVSWSNEDKENGGFDTGVRIKEIEGKSVKDTVRFDEEYGVYWSDVLELILGRFRIIQQEKNKPS